MRDPYDVLGVSKTASSAEIKSAFRRQAKKLHPDTNKHDPRAAARFAELNAAYEILGKVDKRKAFDCGARAAARFAELNAAAARFAELNAAYEILGEVDNRKPFDRGEIDAEGKPRFQGFEDFGAGRGPGGDFGREGIFETFSWVRGFQHARDRTGGGFRGFGDFEDIWFGGASGRPGGFQFEQEDVGPLRPPPAMTRRDKLRGPLIILIASIFAAPIGYYIAAGGWGPSSEPPHGAQMATGPIIDVPPASTFQQEPWLTTTRDDDGGTLAQSEIASKRTEPSRPARSSEDEAVAMVQPSAAGAQAPPSSKGWGPSSEPLPGAQMATGPIIDVPPTSTVQQEPWLTTTRDDDGGTLAQSEIASKRTEPSRPARSSEDEVVAMVQPSAAGAQAPPSSKTIRVLDPQEIELLMKQGEQFIAAGDVVTARTVFQRAVEAGNANAAMALGATYDPTVLAKLGVVGMGADVEKARSWYQTAEKLGSPEARRRLDVLADR